MYINSVLLVFMFTSIFISFNIYSYSNSEKLYFPNGNRHLAFEDFKDFSSLTNMLNGGKKLPCHCEINSGVFVNNFLTLYSKNEYPSPAFIFTVYTVYIHKTAQNSMALFSKGRNMKNTFSKNVLGSFKNVQKKSTKSQS